MKKILLVLFLMLGVVSFSIPKYVDANKLQKNFYKILQDTQDTFIFGKSTQDTGLTVALFNIDDKGGIKKMSEEVKNTAPASQKFVSSRENKRAYIHKFKDQAGGYTYSFVGKNTKVKNCCISVLYTSDKNFKDDELDKVIDKTLNEIESFLK